MRDNWEEKINIFIANMSPYYAFSVIISVVAVIFSLWYTRRSHQEEKEVKDAINLENETENVKAVRDSSSEDEKESSDEREDEREEGEEDDDEKVFGLDDLQARYKSAKHQAIVNHLSSKMTPEQIAEEKRTESAQLEAIFNLLQQQQDKFHVSDMKDVHEQLTLYR